MSHSTKERHRELEALYAEAGQAHVFTFWEGLDTPQRQQLLDDLSCVDLAALPALARLAKSGSQNEVAPGRIEPVEAIGRDTVTEDVVEQGREVIASGRAAALTVAGGMGTRLGFDGPKGALSISPVKDKPLFQLFAESLLATDRRYGSRLQWYVMTSPSNDGATQAFFREHAYFGMIPERVSFFQQGVMPAFDREGRILLDQRHRLALSPDGHGGTLLALSRAGVLADMAERGIEYVSYFQVDNPLVTCIDPVFLGLHVARRSEMSSKCVPKADDFERVGNFVMTSGRLAVIEYSDLPAEHARARQADGSRKFDAGSIAIHVLSRSFAERLVTQKKGFALPWHRALKRTPCVDLDTGERIEPDEPNAIKLESFIFDALPLAENPIVLETSRAEEFSPVKNPTGTDSIVSARRDLSRRAARWLESTGLAVPRTDDGEPDGTFEISPLRALDAAHFAEQAATPAPIEPGAAMYFD